MHYTTFVLACLLPAALADFYLTSGYERAGCASTVVDCPTTDTPQMGIIASDAFSCSSSNGLNSADWYSGVGSLPECTSTDADSFVFTTYGGCSNAGYSLGMNYTGDSTWNLYAAPVGSSTVAYNLVIATCTAAAGCTPGDGGDATFYNEETCINGAGATLVMNALYLCTEGDSNPADCP